MVGGAEHPEPVSRARFTASDTPATIDGVEIAVFDGEAVLFDEASSMLHRLGAIAGAVWICCDGATDVATMIDELTDAFGLEPGEIAAAIQDALQRFADEGLLVGHENSTRLILDSETATTDDGTEILTRPPDP